MPSQSASGSVLVMERPVTCRAIRFAEDGSNESDVWVFAKRHGGDCRGRSGCSGRSFYLYGTPNSENRREQTVFAGDWIVEREQVGVRAITHSDLCARFVLEDGRPVYHAPEARNAAA